MSERLQWFEELPRLPRPLRLVIIIAMHIILFSVAYVGAFLVRFDFTITAMWEPIILMTLPFAVLSKLAVFGALGMFQGWWKYVSLYDIVALARGLLVAEGVFIALNLFVLDPPTFPRSIYFLDFGLALFLIGGTRGSLRLLREGIRSRARFGGEMRNLLILGAGDTGETLVREINKNRNLPYRPIGYLDDDPYKRGLRIHGIPVFGPISSVEDVVENYSVQEIIIAMPSASREEMRRVVDAAKATDVNVKILPAVEAILDGRVSLNQLREVSLSDLLGREPVRLDTQSIGRFIESRRVMVTGAGGSIGSEICRQVLRFEPESVIMVERGETPLFLIHRELGEEHNSDALVPCIADVSDRDRMEHLFMKHRPEVVIHAAAYKHVPLMENHPAEAVRNNVVGTRVVADLASEHGVSNFVLISTDKAVNPTSVMGATKRITELYVLSRNADYETEFCAVRFGNVLGSNGSVVPIFREQIEKGGPVTVTHPEMTRYFMTIPEASQLVLQAAAIGEGGELFILDMGEPVKIADLARDMIRLSGLSESDIEITFTGVRPGEKLFEELTLDEENVGKTKHKKIFVGAAASEELHLLHDHFAELERFAHEGDDLRVRLALKAIVPQFAWEPVDNVYSLSDGNKIATPTP